MTPTFANTRRVRQRGLTLFELLIALALIALMALMASSGMRKSSPHLAVKLASEQLLADLKRARLEADATYTPVSITLNEHGYSIAALRIERSLPRGVSVQIEGGGGHTITIGPGFWLNAYEIVLAKSDAHSMLTIDAITRRMALQ